MIRKLASIVIVMALMLPVGLTIASDSMQYTPVKAIGFGPLAGEMTTPVTFGMDETGKIFVLDGSNGIGSIFMPDGKFFQTFTAPDDLTLSSIKSTLSVSYGNICYINGNDIVVANRNGVINKKIRQDKKHIYMPIATKIGKDLSVVVADAITGVNKFNSSGIFEKNLLQFGNGVDFMTDCDLSGDNGYAIIQIKTPIPEKEPSETNLFNEIKVFLFNSDFSKKTEFKLETNENFNPNHIQIRLDKKGFVNLFDKNNNSVIVFDNTGSKIAEFVSGQSPAFNFLTGSSNIYYISKTDFFATNSQGKFLGSYGIFSKEKMQFANPTDIATCSNGTVALYDMKRNDIQFFGEKNYLREINFGESAVNIIFVNNLQENINTYSVSNSSFTKYDCVGGLQDRYEFDTISPTISAITQGKDGELWAVDPQSATIRRLNRLGKLISSFGSQGTREGQLVDPSDILIGPEGNVYVLNTGNNRIDVFKTDGTFVRVFGNDIKPPLAHPKSFTFTKDFELFVTDTGNNRLVAFGLDGKHLYSTGSSSPSRTKNTIGDYWKDLGTFNRPTKIRSSGDKLFVLDAGNLRLQILEKVKIEPKLSVNTTSLDFGSLPTQQTITKEIVITNKGNGILEGTIETTIPWIQLSRTKLTGNETKITVTIDQDKVPYWDSAGTITIKTNAGNHEIKCVITRNGKTIQLQVGSKSAKIDGKETTLNVPPTIIAGNTLVPLRFIGEGLGAKVDWVAAEKKVIYTLNDKVVILWIGNKTAMINDKPSEMKVAPQIISGSTLVPLRFISEALGASVEWIAETKGINIHYPPKP
jgi:hypothetical protein